VSAKAKEYCVHGGSATKHPMTTRCFRTKRAAQRFMREERRSEPGWPMRMQALSGARKRRRRR
jgi:hypothetical protein